MMLISRWTLRGLKRLRRAVQENAAGGRLEQTCDEFDDGGLAGAVLSTSASACPFVIVNDTSDSTSRSVSG
jgi:hypothetical protein